MSQTPNQFQSITSIQPKVLMSDYTTFRLGGPCKGMIHCQAPEELIKFVQDLAQMKSPFILIGGGSNLVVSDKGLDCYVIRYVSDEPLIKRDGDDLIISGSTILDKAVLFAAEHALEGLNYASGIPGTVGGAVVGNAGAFGQQVGDVLESVTLMDKSGKVYEAEPEDLGFNYRYSNLRETEHIVVSARFSMRSGDRDKLLKEREEILITRREKHPDLSKEPCAGSFFRNIEPTSKAERRQATGYFLEQAGGKNLTHGGAYIFSKHANIIVKGENCTAQDVYELSNKMAALAKDKHNLDLIREVKFIGPFEGADKTSSLIW